MPSQFAKQIRFAFLLAACLALSVTLRSLSATITGVVLRPPVAPTSTLARERYRAAAGSSLAADAERGPDCHCNPALYSVVWLTGESIAAQPTNDTVTPTMKQHDKMFEPTVLAISVGQSVEFPNGDPFYHNVFSYSKTKKFDLGRYSNGHSKTIAFDSPGIVEVYCEIHEGMRGYIHVLATPYRAVSNDYGRFTMGDIPPGSYTMHVWQEKQSLLTQDIIVGQDSLFVEVNK